VTVLVLVPGLGDDVQSLKAGVMEIADIFVVNKSDLPGAERVEAEILAMQGLGAHEEHWLPPVVRTVASSGDGVEALLAAVDRCLVATRGCKQKQLQGRNTEILRFAQNDLRFGGGLNDLRFGGGLNDLRFGGGLNDLSGGLRLDHLGIAVKSIAAARGFYELLGMAVTHEETVEHEQVKTAMLPMGESRIELLEPTAEDSTIGRFLAKRGEGLHHVAMRVEAIDERFAAMQAAGIRLASDRVRVGAGGHRYFFVHPASTGGVLLELVGE